MFRPTGAILGENIDRKKILKTCGIGGITLHTFLTWTPYVDVAQLHVAAALTSDKSSLCPKYRRMCGLYTRS
jgi:hypothetical protein